MLIEPGRRVSLHYTLALKDGTIVDSTDGAVPATFVIGSGELVALLEQRLLGLSPGERRRFELSAEETRAPLRQEAVQRIARADFPPGLEINPGEVFGFQTPDGQEVPGQVLSVTEDEVTVDFSHPLAGRDLVFDVEILAVEPA